MGDYTQPEDVDDRIREGDRKLVAIAGHPVTVNEWHAFKYGFPGVFVGMLYTVEPFEAIAISVVACAVALGFRAVSKEKCGKVFAIATIRHEPHYFIGAYLAAFAIGAAVATYVPMV